MTSLLGSLGASRGASPLGSLGASIGTSLLVSLSLGASSGTSLLVSLVSLVSLGATLSSLAAPGSLGVSLRASALGPFGTTMMVSSISTSTSSHSSFQYSSTLRFSLFASCASSTNLTVPSCLPRLPLPELLGLGGEAALPDPFMTGPPRLLGPTPLLLTLASDGLAGVVGVFGVFKPLLKPFALPSRHWV